MLRLNQRNILNISAFWKHHIDTSCLFKNQQNGWLTCEIVTFPPRKFFLTFINHLFTRILHMDLLLGAKQQRRISTKFWCFKKELFG